MKLSARNQFKGTVVEIIEGAVNGYVKIDIGGGNIISSNISMASIKELGLVGQVFAISVAMPSETRDYLKEGVLQCVGLWDPAVTAKCMLNLAVKMHAGEKIETGVNLGEAGYESVEVTGTLIVGDGALAITAENVDNFTFSIPV